MAEMTDTELAKMITQLRDRRKASVEARWLLNYRAWNSKNTRRFFISDTFNHHVPAFRRAVERAVTRTVQMLLPSPQFFEVYPLEELNDQMGDRAEAVHAYLRYILVKKIKVRPVVSQLARCIYLYARAISKTGVRVQRVEQQAFIWPTMRAVDPFAFFVWPETVPTADQAQVIVEDHMMPYQVYKSLAEKRGVNQEPITESIAQEKLIKPEWPSHWTERLNEQGIPAPSDVRRSTKEDFVAISEVWSVEDDGWSMKWLVWNLEDGPKVVRTNTAASHPYRLTTARPLPGEHYTSGMGDDVEPMQVLLDDQVNMTLEGQAMSFGPIAVIDPDAIGRSQSLIWRPRAKWLADPKGVSFMQAPDTLRSGLAGMQMSLGMIDSFSGSSPLAEGQPTRNLPRAGFAVSSLLNLSLADTREVAIGIEDDILTPSLADIYGNTIEFIPQEQIIKIPGGHKMAAQRVTKTDLAGDWEFAWVGSIQAQDLQVRAQRLMTFLDLLGKAAPILIPDLRERGKRINWTGLLTRLWRDGLGERGADSLIEDITPQDQVRRVIEMMAAQQASNGGAQGRPGAQPQVATSPGDVGARLQRLLTEGAVGEGLEM